MKHSEEELFSYLQAELRKKALADGRADCARAAEGNAQVIEAIREWITEEPEAETPAIVATLIGQFTAVGGPLEISDGNLMLMWAMALIQLAGRDVEP